MFDPTDQRQPLRKIDDHKQIYPTERVLPGGSPRVSNDDVHESRRLGASYYLGDEEGRDRT